MTHLEIIDEYNRNVHNGMLQTEAWQIYQKRVDEYKKNNMYATDFMFLYPDVLGWNESWLGTMESYANNKTNDKMLETLKRLCNQEKLDYNKVCKLAEKINKK